MIHAYLRVSTREQTYGMGAQRDAITAACDEPTLWYHDVGESGKSMERPGLAALLDCIQAGDTLICSKLDRLARSTVGFCELIDKAQSEGWHLNILNLALNTATPTGRFTATIFAALAQLEREMISERTKDGLAEAKRNGVKLGRPSALPLSVVRRIKGWSTVGATQATIADWLNKAEIPTPGNGERWSRQQVARVLRAG